jgi:hypothetical protein
MRHATRQLRLIAARCLNDPCKAEAALRAARTQFGVYGVFELPEGVIVRHHREEWIELLTRAFTPLVFEQRHSHNNEWKRIGRLPVLGSYIPGIARLRARMLMPPASGPSPLTRTS